MTNVTHLKINAGSSFTLRGLVDDPCAVVSATITDTNGDVNTVNGEVERSGVLWVENLPLAEGTNWITLSVTNAAGLMSETNISVVQSSMTLALTWIDGDLWNPTVNVGGTISPYSGYTVWVNGVQATNNGDDTWDATNVPVSASGVASFDMSASSGGGDPFYNTNVVKDAEVRVVDYHETKSDAYSYPGLNTSTYSRQKDFTMAWTNNAAGQWFAQGYNGKIVDQTTNYVFDPSGDTNTETYWWSGTNGNVFYEHEVYSDTNGVSDYDSTNFPGNIGNDYEFVTTGVPDLDQEYLGLWSVLPHDYAENNGVHWQTNYSDGSGIDVTVSARTRLMLFTGGKAGVHHLNLIQLQCSGLKYGAPSGTWGAPWLDMEMTTIPPSTMKVLGQNPGSDGNLWVAEPDNAGLELNLTAPGVKHYGAWVTPTKYKLIHQTVNPALTDTNLCRLNLGVGEQVNLTIQPALPTNYIPVWSASAGGFSSPFVNNPTFTAPSNAATAVISLEVMTATITNAFTFNVLEPTGIATNTYKVYDYTNAPNLFGTNVSGAGMYIRVYVAPTDVSFYKVQCMEVGEDATNVTGYYTNSIWTTDTLSHKGSTGTGKGDVWFQIFDDNSWQHDGSGVNDWDRAVCQNFDPPPAWTTGGFAWNIPGQWKIGSGPTNSIANGWNQTFTLGADGTMTIQKFGLTVARGTNAP